jgi:hypothetical protein
MTRSRTLSEKLALSDFSPRWDRRYLATQSTRRGSIPDGAPTAVSILEIADAAEQAWLRAEGARIFT